MIKNKKAVNEYGNYYIYIYLPHASTKDWVEVCLAPSKKSYRHVSANFVTILIKEAPTFHNTHKLLENAITEQFKECVNDQG